MAVEKRDPHGDVDSDREEGRQTLDSRSAGSKLHCKSTKIGAEGDACGVWVRIGKRVGTLQARGSLRALHCVTNHQKWTLKKARVVFWVRIRKGVDRPEIRVSLQSLDKLHRKSAKMDVEKRSL